MHATGANFEVQNQYILLPNKLTQDQELKLHEKQNSSIAVLYHCTWNMAKPHTAKSTE